MKDEKKNKRQLISELEAFRGKLARYEEKSRLKPEHEIAIHLQRANRALRVISEFNQRLVRADKEQELLEVVCRILVNIGRYRFAWVGFARQDRAGTVQPVAQFGFEADYLEKVKISWRNNRYGQGPTGRAIREKKPAVSRYILTDPNFAPWRKEAIMRGYASSIALPLVQENRVLGALNIYAAEPDAFDADEIKLLTELANDLAFGVLSIRDKKENDEAQKKLVESEEKFRSIVEYSHAGILLLDDAYHITYANKQIYTISGFSQRELIGRDFRELFDSKTKKEVLSRYRKRLKGEPLSSTFAFNLRRKDGALRWVESRSSTFTDREGKTHTIAQLLDTTQKKKTEEALREELKRNRLILQTTLDGYILADTNGKIIDVNPSYCEMVQYSREELLKMNIRDVEVQIPLEEIDRRIKQMVGKGWDRFETRHRCKDGTVLDLEVSIVIMQHEEESLVAAFVRDITDRKRAEEKLRSLSAVVEQSTEGMAITDLNGKITYVNDAWCKMHGYQDSEKLLGKNLAIFHTKKQVENEVKPFNEKVKEFRTYSGEVEHLTRDGKTFPALMATTLIKDEQGKPVALAGIVKDISHLKRTQEALRESEERFRLAFHTSPDSININRLEDGLYVDINKGFTEITGYTREEVIGRTSLEINIWDKPEDRQRLVEGLKKRGRVTNLEAKFRMKNGRTLTGLISASVIKLQGVPHIISVTRSIEEIKQTEIALRESEDKFRSLAEESLVGVYLVQDGVFKYVNPKFAAIFGFSIDEIINRKKLQDLIAPEDWEMVQKHLQDRFSGKVKSVNYEFRAITREQRSIWVEVHGSISVFRGKPAILGTLLDITERKKAEKRLRQSAAQLRALSEHLQTVREEERSQIAHEIHDELGQALTVLKMDTAWLAKKLSPGTELLRKKIQSMSQLIDNTIKVVQRVSSELKPSILEDLGLTAAVEWQTLEFEKRSGISCEVNFAMKKNVVLPHKLELTLFRILQETLTNVYRHARASKVKVELKEKSNRIILKIEDNGVGIKESQLSDPASFGLLGMRERIFPWGGKVDIRGIDQKGTTVTVTVPLTIQQEKWDD